jgi:hypothetical protein
MTTVASKETKGHSENPKQTNKLVENSKLTCMSPSKREDE